MSTSAASQSDQEKDVYSDGTISGAAESEDEIEGELSQNTGNEDLYSKGSAAAGYDKIPPPLPPRATVPSQISEALVQSPRSADRLKSVEIGLRGLFQDITTLSSDLKRISLPGMETRVVDAVNYALEYAIEPILGNVHEGTAVGSEQMSACSGAARLDEYLCPAEEKIVECQTRLAPVMEIIKSADRKGEWDDHDQILLQETWQGLAFKVSQLADLMAGGGIDLNMITLLAQPSPLASLGQRTLSVQEDVDDQRSEVSSVRSASVFSKTSYINQARRRKFRPSRRGAEPDLPASMNPIPTTQIRGGGRFDSNDDPPPYVHDMATANPTRRWATVTADYTSSGSQQLELRLGDQVVILGDRTGSQWYGKSIRGEGWFPAANIRLWNYPELHKPDRLDSDENPSPVGSVNDVHEDASQARVKNAVWRPGDALHIHLNAKNHGLNQIFLGETLSGIAGQHAPPSLSPYPGTLAAPSHAAAALTQEQGIPDQNIQAKFYILIGLTCTMHLSMMVLLYLK